MSRQEEAYNLVARMTFNTPVDHQILEKIIFNMSVRSIMENVDGIDLLNGFLYCQFLNILQRFLLDNIWKELCQILDLPSLGIGVRPQESIFIGKRQLCIFIGKRHPSTDILPYQYYQHSYPCRYFSDTNIINTDTN